MKPRLLLISGWGFPPAMWTQTVEALDPVCDCVVLDCTEVLTRDRPADRLRQELDTQRTCFVGGWSLGGMLALQGVPQELAADVQGLLLISSTPHFCQDGTQSWGVPIANLRAMRNALRNQPGETLRNFHQLAAAPFACEPNGLDAEPDRIDALDTGLQYLLETDLRNQAGNAGLPTVLLHGRSDEIIPITGSRTLALQLMPSRLDLVVDVGHDLPLRRPDVLAKGVHALARMS